MERSQINYPIMYAIQTHYSPFNRTDKREPIGYTVSKVYYLGSTTKANDDGTTDTIHHVVYPFKNIQDLEDNKRTLPVFNDEGICTNEEDAYEVLDSLDAAEYVRNEYYRAFYFHYISGYPRDEYLANEKSIRLEFFDESQLFELYEAQGLELTQDMIVDKKTNTNGKVKVL